MTPEVISEHLSKALIRIAFSMDPWSRNGADGVNLTIVTITILGYSDPTASSPRKRNLEALMAKKKKKKF